MLGGPVGFGLHEGLSPVFEVRVGFSVEPQVNESGAEFFSEWALVFCMIIVHKNSIKIRGVRRRQGLKRVVCVKACDPSRIGLRPTGMGVA